MCSVLLLKLTNTALIHLWLENGVPNYVAQRHNAICLPTWTKTGDHITWELTLQGLYHVTASRIFFYKLMIAQPVPVFLLLSVLQFLCCLPISPQKDGSACDYTCRHRSRPRNACILHEYNISQISQLLGQNSKVDKLRRFEFDSFIWSLLYLISFFDLVREVYWWVWGYLWNCGPHCGSKYFPFQNI